MFRRLSTQRLNPPLHPVKTTLLLAVITLISGTQFATAAAVSLTAIGNAYAQNFDTLASSGTTNSTLPAGWAFFESGSSANTTYSAGTGSSTTGDTYSFGPSGAGERALGSLASNNVTSLFGVHFTNQTGQTITGLDVEYIGELWRLGATGRTDKLDFAYSLDAVSLTTGVWVDFDTLDFLTPVTSGATGAKAGNDSDNQSLVSGLLGLTINQGDSLWLRWSDPNISGNDDGLAVDNFSITPLGASHPTPEGGLGALLTGLILIGTLLVAKSLRRRSESAVPRLCPVKKCL
jgi:hypothetical protein